MKIVFEGSPEQVLTEMKDYIVRSGFHFGEQALVTTSKEPEKNQTVAKTSNEVEKIETAPEVPQERPLEELPQKSEEPVCRFCGKYTTDSVKRLARHEMHCKSNPQRIPSAMEGRPMNPALKAWQEKQRQEKLQRSGQSTNGTHPKPLQDDESKLGNENDSDV